MRILKQLPNAITCCNLLCGCLAIVFALRYHFEYALITLLIAAVFDFLDGLAARLLKAYSSLGKELDSLADMVSFGVAPSLISFSFLLYLSSIDPGDKISLFYYVPFLIAPFSAIRLAKFNLDDSQSENFIGLATPAASLLIVSLVVWLKGLIGGYIEPTNGAVDSALIDATALDSLEKAIRYERIIVILFSAIISLLLISPIPMFSLKIKSISWNVNKTRYIFFIIATIEILIAIFFGFNYSILLFAILLTYILFNLFKFLFSPSY